MKFKPVSVPKWLILSLVLSCSAVQAGVFSCNQTTLSLGEPAIDGIDRVVFEWRGVDESSDGYIWQNGSQSELSDLKMEVWSGETLIYTDIVITDGVAQPFGDRERDLSDVFWEFYTVRPTLRQFSNFMGAPNPTGTHYRVADGINLPSDGEVWITKYVDGSSVSRLPYYLAQQVTSCCAYLDADCDGYSDIDDECTYSDLAENVVIGECDSHVPNSLYATGCTISDLVAEQAALASNHGLFVSGVAHLSNDLNDAGVITGAQSGAIQACVAREKSDRN